jgi:hypothetical protein
VPSSGLGTDPFPTCPTDATLFICGQGTRTFAAMPSNEFEWVSSVWNFTGATSASLANSQSYVCALIGVGGFGCNMDSGASNVVSAGTTYQFLSTLAPWVDIEGKSFHVGFWAQQSLSSRFVMFGNQANYIGSGGSGDVFAVFVPNPICPGTGGACQIAPNSDTGSFIGWLKDTFIQNTCNSLRLLTLFLADPCTALSNTGQDITTAFINAMLAVLGVIVQGMQLMLNQIGTLWGDPLFGTHLMQLLVNAIGAAITILTGIGIMTLWIANFFTITLPFVIGSFITVIVAVSVALLAVVLAFLPLLLAFGGLINMPLQSLFFFDYVFGITEVIFNGVPGFNAWLRFNIWVTTIGFRGLEYLVTKVMWVIGWFEERIPVIG